MRITRRQLRRLIKEEISLLSETTALDTALKQGDDIKKKRQDDRLNKIIDDSDRKMRDSLAKIYSKGITALGEGGNISDLVGILGKGAVVWMDVFYRKGNLFVDIAMVGEGWSSRHGTYWPISLLSLTGDGRGGVVSVDRSSSVLGYLGWKLKGWEQIDRNGKHDHGMKDAYAIGLQDLLEKMEESLQDMNSRFDSEEAEATEESTQDQMPESWLQILGKCLEG